MCWNSKHGHLLFSGNKCALHCRRGKDDWGIKQYYFILGNPEVFLIWSLYNTVIFRSAQNTAACLHSSHTSLLPREAAWSQSPTNHIIRLDSLQFSSTVRLMLKAIQDQQVVQVKIKDVIRINREQVKSSHGLPNTQYILIFYTNTILVWGKVF